MKEDKNSHDDSFKQMNKKEKIATIIGILLLLILVGGFVLGIFFLGFAGMFRVLGVQYDSNWALILFVVLFFVIGFFFDFIFRVLTNLTKRYMSDQRISFSITFLFNLIKNGLVLFLVDDLMRSITLSFTTKLILAFLLSMVDSILDEREMKRETSS